MLNWKTCIGPRVGFKCAGWKEVRRRIIERRCSMMAMVVEVETGRGRRISRVGGGETGGAAERGRTRE